MPESRPLASPLSALSYAMMGLERLIYEGRSRQIPGRSVRAAQVERPKTANSCPLNETIRGNRSYLFGFPKREPVLIANSVALPLPLLEGGQSFLPHQLDHWNRPLRQGNSQLLVDERIVESNGGRIGSRVSEVHSSRPRPVNCAQAHGARLAGCINFAAFELELRELAAGFSNRHHFRVRRGIAGGSHDVRTGRQDLAVFHHHRCERSALSTAYVFNGQVNRPSHEPVLHKVNCSVESRLTVSPRTQKALIFLASAGVSCAFFIDFCALVFLCGCHSLLHGASSACNIHLAGVHHCPWCAHTPAFAFAAMVGPQALISFRPAAWSWWMRLVLALA